MRRRLRVWLWLPILLAGCNWGRPSVVRVVDGHPIEGDYIDPVTYALFARGAYHEHRGELPQAQRAYEAAAERDPESAEIWSRLAAVLCASKSAGHERAFALAERADPEFSALWHERARCALARGETAAAVEHAERAVAYEPRHQAHSLVLADALERLGRTDAALRVLYGLTVAHPNAASAWELLAKIARRRGRDADLRRAESALARLSRAGVARKLAPASEDLSGLDAAIAADDAASASRIAIDRRVPREALALRAAALGRAELAREQAELVLAADPSNTDAWIAALVASDLVADASGYQRSLAALDREPLGPSSLAARLLADLISRRVGPEAASAWLKALGPLPPPADALEKRVDERLAALR